MTFPQRLDDGYTKFLRSRLPLEQNRYRELSEDGQSPEIMVIGCCDSRVSPEVIFDAKPGELFVARNIANLVPPYTPDGAQRAMSAALEFAVQALRVKHVVVLAHAQCGGIRAYAEEAEPLSPGDFIGNWMAMVAPAAKMVGRRGARRSVGLRPVDRRFRARRPGRVRAGVRPAAVLTLKVKWPARGRPFQSTIVGPLR